MRLLALDIGNRRTGVAFYDPAIGIVMPLDTIKHASKEELLAAVTAIVQERNVGHVTIGLPLLLSGIEGSQTSIVREVVQYLEESGISCSLLDERCTTPKSGESDGDAAAACSLLSLALQKVVDKDM